MDTPGGRYANSPFILHTAHWIDPAIPAPVPGYLKCNEVLPATACIFPIAEKFPPGAPHPKDPKLAEFGSIVELPMQR